MGDYRFSMTGASLMVAEFVRLAESARGIGFQLDQLTSDGIEKDRAGTRKREFSELKLRLATLSSQEIEYLSSTGFDNQRLVSFIACVRSYRILKEFIDEVVLSKLQVFDYEISAMDFSNFMYNKSIDIDEIHQLSEGTKKKVQQVVFKLFEQAGLIDNVRTKKLQVPFLDYSLQMVLPAYEHRYLLNI